MQKISNVVLHALAATANRAATFDPMKASYERPTITVAGVHVALYVDAASRKVRVSIDLDETEPWLLRDDNDDSVPLRICVQGNVVFDG